MIYHYVILFMDNYTKPPLEDEQVSLLQFNLIYHSYIIQRYAY